MIERMDVPFASPACLLNKDTIIIQLCERVNELIDAENSRSRPTINHSTTYEEADEMIRRRRGTWSLGDSQ